MCSRKYGKDSSIHALVDVQLIICRLSSMHDPDLFLTVIEDLNKALSGRLQLMKEPSLQMKGTSISLTLSSSVEKAWSLLLRGTSRSNMRSSEFSNLRYKIMKTRGVAFWLVSEIFEATRFYKERRAPVRRLICASCDESAENKCRGCQMIWYCSPECQSGDLAYHSPDCQPRQDL